MGPLIGTSVKYKLSLTALAPDPVGSACPNHRQKDGKNSGGILAPETTTPKVKYTRPRAAPAEPTRATAPAVDAVMARDTNKNSK